MRSVKNFKNSAFPYKLMSMFINKFKKIFLATAFTLALGTVFADGEPEKNAETQSKESAKKNIDINEEIQREFHITVSAMNFNLNPHTAAYSMEAQILDGLYEGLYSYDPRTLEPKNALATECKLSRDKLRVTYKIREDAKFSDGQPINAFSVRNAWLMLIATPNAPYASFLDCVKGAREFRAGKIPESEVGIQARDNTTLVLHLNAPTAHLNKILCHHAFAIKTGSDNVFSGAFVLKERTDNMILLEKNQNYWDAENVHIPSVRISTSDEIVDNAWDFNMGKVDWIASVFNSKTILNQDSVRLAAIFGTEYIFFKCQNSPWDKAEFRNALISAVPWSRLRKNSLIKATTLIYPLNGYPKVEGLSDTETEDAIDMIKEAKKAAGIGENEKLKLKFDISATSTRQQDFYEILKEAWAPLGIELEAKITNDYRYVESIPSSDADLFVYSWIGDFADPLAFLELFKENSTLNQTKWQNEKFNALLKEASLTNDNEEHNKLLANAEQVLIDDGVIMPVQHSISLNALNINAVGGWYTNALDIHPYKYLYFKEYKSAIPNVVLLDNKNNTKKIN